ncbi:hypothetical protein LTR01_001379 [Friedmanniomyces endolithicus]|nr:hypothetical protein LTS09_001809 [Friedmanniomyces endolithicus]KAK0314556.1 hypothetical protein LTR01_001379 [Friedmanniomyces endolithicus]KAK0827642.1 hypothetical protein LTR73_005244 [Friedmanniomyces endolithicus]
MSTTLSYASSLTATRSFGTGLRGTPSRFTRGNATVTNHTTTTTLSHPSGATRQQPTITVGSQTESRQPPLSPDVTFRSKASRFTARKVFPASVLSETTRSAFTTPSGPVTPANPKAGHWATNQPTCTSDVTTDQVSILQRFESAGIQVPEFADTTEMAMFCADAQREVQRAETVAEEMARFRQMIAEFMEEYRQRCLVTEALGLRPAHDPPLKRDPRFEEAWNEVVIARRRQNARTANMCDLESASSAVPSQMQPRLPETSKHDQDIGLQADIQETALAAGVPLSHPSLKVFRTAHDPPRAFRLGTSRPMRRQMAEAEKYAAEAALAAEMPGPTFVEPASTAAQYSGIRTWGSKGTSRTKEQRDAAAAALERSLAPPQASIEDLIAKYQSQPRAFKRARPRARLQPNELAAIIGVPVYRSEPPASTLAPLADDAAAGDVDNAFIVDHTEWDRRFEIAEARRQERQVQLVPELELKLEAGDVTGIFSKLSSWACSAMAWVKEKIWG